MMVDADSMRLSLRRAREDMEEVRGPSLPTSEPSNVRWTAARSDTVCGLMLIDGRPISLCSCVEKLLSQLPKRS